MKPNKLSIYTLLLLVVLVCTSNLSAQTTIEGVELVYHPRVQDIRAYGGMRGRAANVPGTAFDMRDLTVGSIFITEDNQARKVTAIYTQGGRTIIETETPQPEEVIKDVYIPDFDIVLDESHIQTLAPGVTYGTQGIEADGPVNLLAESAASIPTTDDSAYSADTSDEDLSGPRLSRIQWLETDPRTQGMTIQTYRIDQVLWRESISQSDVEQLEQKKAAGKSTPENESVEVTVGGKPSLEMGTEGEIRLTGVLRLASPRVTGGWRNPSIKLSWIRNWWHPPIPVISFTKGYGRVGVEAAQQFDFILKGTLSLESEAVVPIAALSVQDTSKTVRLNVGLSLIVNLDGSISLAVEASEYTYTSVGVQADLVFPMIPVKASAQSAFHLNTAFRPMLAADAELRGGLYLGGSFSMVGMTVASLTAGGGLYITADGFMEPLGIMGFDSRYGGYGNFDDWLLFVNAEAGSFATIDSSILWWDKSLFFRRWPFWVYSGEWEF